MSSWLMEQCHPWDLDVLGIGTYLYLCACGVNGNGCPGPLNTLSFLDYDISMQWRVACRVAKLRGGIWRK